MTGGRLIAVVGPSGVGKDSIIDGLCARRPDLTRIRRTVTRAAELGGEDFDPISEPHFQDLVDAGAFCLHWQAHGLLYGIPQTAQVMIAGGQDCIVNLSRNALVAAAAKFPRLVVLSVTTAPAALARRLALRGRETEIEIAARLARQTDTMPTGLPTLNINNDTTLSAAIEQSLVALYPERV